MVGFGGGQNLLLFIKVPSGHWHRLGPIEIPSRHFSFENEGGIGGFGIGILIFGHDSELFTKVPSKHIFGIVIGGRGFGGDGYEMRIAALTGRERSKENDMINNISIPILLKCIIFTPIT